MLQTLLQKRSNGYYYFRWVFPSCLQKSLGRRELVKSLKTSSKHQALARAGVYYMLVENLKSLNQQYESGSISGVEYDGKVYEMLMQRLTESMVEGLDLYKPLDLADVKLQKSKVSHAIQMIRNSLTNESAEAIEGEGVSIQEKVLKLIDTHPQLELVKYLADSYKNDPLLSSRFEQDIVSIFHWILEKVFTKLDSSAIPASLPSYLAFGDGKIVTPSAQVQNESLTLSQLFGEFMAHKITNNNLSDKLRKDYRADFPLFLHFIGNKPIDQIVRRDVKKCLLSCLKFPRRNLRPYRGVPVPELAALEVPESHWLSARSVFNLQKFMQGIFAYAREQEYIKESPAENLNLEFKLKKNRTHLQVHEVVRLLNVALENKHEWRKWFVLLAAYTGARRGEIAQLRVSDFKIDEESGIKYLLITDEEGDLKTYNALRRVPVHEKLIELGLYEFLSGVGIKLFPEGADNAMTRHFPLIMKAAGVEKTTDLKQNRTLHSLRHSFITQTRGNGHSPDLVQSIVGHEVMSMGVTDGYTGEFSVDKLMPVVSSLKYL
jgi:integrase